VVNGATFTLDMSADTNSALDHYSIGATRHSDTAGLPAGQSFARSRGTHGTETIVQSGDALGTIYFSGFDGTDFALAASIAVVVAGTPGANDMPGEVLINASADGSQSPSEVASFTALGLQLGNANSRVTTILDEDNMASDSDTALATQQSIKAYVDTHISPGVPVWSTIAGTTQAATINSGYVVGNAAQTTVTLPSTFAVGELVIVEGLGAGGFIVQANAGDTILTSAGSTSSGGTLTCALAAGNAYLVGLVANTTWKLYNTNTSMAIA